jgi:hypothetical protein
MNGLEAGRHAALQPKSPKESATRDLIRSISFNIVCGLAQGLVGGLVEVVLSTRHH